MSGYAGSELESFETAHNWKRYLFDLLRPHIRDRVLEVGAGIGGTTRFLAQAPHREWLCLEPDPKLAEQIRTAVRDGSLPPDVRVQVGTTSSLEPAAMFETALYIDVLEHLEDDRRELETVSRHLADGGSLVVAGPAMPWLYSRFDAAIGHYRRYTRRSLLAAVPEDFELVGIRYLDSAGVLLSLANRMLLRSPSPTRAQITLWDRRVVPLSRRLDAVLGRAVGKSFFGVWRKRVRA